MSSTVFMKKIKIQNQQKSPRRKSSAKAAPQAVASKTGGRATTASQTANKATSHAPRGKKASSRKRRPSLSASIGALQQAMRALDSVPEPIRHAAGHTAATFIDDWLKQSRDTAGTKRQSAAKPSRSEALSICFFAPSLSEAQRFCERVFAAEFRWADEGPANEEGSVRVRRCRNDHDLGPGAIKSVESFIRAADLIIFEVDMGAETRGSSSVLPVAKKIKQLASAKGVPALFLVTNSKADIPGGYSSHELADSRERWLRIMRHKKTAFVDATECAREDVVAVSFMHKIGATVTVAKMLSKLPLPKRALLLDAISSDLCPKDLKRAPSSFAAFAKTCGGHLKNGAGQVWHFLRENPEVWNFAKGAIIFLAQSVSAPSASSAKRRR